MFLCKYYTVLHIINLIIHMLISKEKIKIHNTYIHWTDVADRVSCAASRVIFLMKKKKHEMTWLVRAKPNLKCIDKLAVDIDSNEKWRLSSTFRSVHSLPSKETVGNKNIYDILRTKEKTVIFFFFIWNFRIVFFFLRFDQYQRKKLWIS